MASRLMGVILTVVAMLVISPALYAQSAVQTASADGTAIPRRDDGKPDLTGVWDRPGAARQGAAYLGTSVPGPQYSYVT